MSMDKNEQPSHDEEELLQVGRRLDDSVSGSGNHQTEEYLNDDVSEEAFSETLADEDPALGNSEEGLDIELPEDAESEAEGSPEDVPEEEMEFISDKNAAVLMKTPKGGRFLIYTMLAALTTSLVWASVAELDEITRGMGIIVPSSHLQVVQNLEGGILEEIYVTEGQHVSAGEPIMRLDDTRFSSNYRESAVEYYSELAKAARLKAELSGTPLKFPDELAGYEDYVNRETDIFEQRSEGLKGQLDVANRQVSQVKHELAASEAQLEFLTTSYELGEEELALTKPLAKQGVVSKVELLQLKQRVNDLDSERRMTELSLPKLTEAHKESVARKKELTLQFREEVVQELKGTEVLLDQLTESRGALEDKVVRTVVRSPMDGIVKTVYINTLGGIVQPGADLVEIVPIDDKLVIEAEISPKDIGFLREGMKSMVKLTAYDFAIYGGLEGKVEHISADTIEDEKGESFYVVHIRTDKSYLGTEDKPLEVIPGMHTNVDIITGKKTLMEYLLKPILRAKRNALTER